jgi:hypothetical protein
MSPRLIDLTGQRYGRLRVLAIHPERVRYGKDKRAVAALWHCVCDCGAERLVLGSNLRQGLSTSCGCRSRKHGLSKTRAYTVWNAMMQRCFNPNSRAYCWYGERGITVCKDYCDFMNWRADWGEAPPGKSRDRIDNDGNYEPENLRWATASVQARNQRPRKRKARRAKLDDINAYAAALARAGMRAAP